VSSMCQGSDVQQGNQPHMSGLLLRGAAMAMAGPAPGRPPPGAAGRTRRGSSGSLDTSVAPTSAL
jgi:hypothetical protein